MDADGPEHGVNEPDEPCLVTELVKLPTLAVGGVVAVEAVGGRTPLG